MRTAHRIPLAAAGIAAGLFMAGAAQADPCEAPLPRSGAVFEGPVEYVGDGDSLCVRTSAGLVEVRIEDFNAPELNQVGGRAARQALIDIARGRRARCRADHRSWDRIVARCNIDGRSIGDRLRAAGVREGGN